MVTAAGGCGLAAVVDHQDEDAVAELVARITKEKGHLDLLVNCVWGGDNKAQWGTAIDALDVGKGRAMLDQAIVSHIITTKAMLPLLRLGTDPLVVEGTDGAGGFFRGALFYDLVKNAVIRLAFATAESLRESSICAVAVTPGFLRSEAVLKHFGVTCETWRDAIATDPHFAHSETPIFVGRGIAALAALDADAKAARNGRVFASWGLATEFGLTDTDGSVPNWGAHAADSDFGRDHAASHARFLNAFPHQPSPP